MMKSVLLVNDTSTDGHPGSSLVIKNLESLISQRGGIVTKRISGKAADDVNAIVNSSNTYDIVIVNGEGTMHSDRSRANNLLKLASLANPNSRKFLINSIWERNSELNSYLPLFDKIFVRESLSAHNIRAANFECSIVPDLIFATPIPSVDHVTSNYQQISVTDHVRTQKSLELFDFCAGEDYSFIALQNRTLAAVRRNRIFNFLKYSLKRKIRDCSAPSNFIQELQQSSFIFSGRFHATCMAILLQKPFVAINSNTRKVYGLLSDIGLERTALAMSFSPNMTHSIRQKFSEQNHYAAMRIYCSQAKASIDTMMDDIFS